MLTGNREHDTQETTRLIRHEMNCLMDCINIASCTGDFGGADRALAAVRGYLTVLRSLGVPAVVVEVA